MITVMGYVYLSASDGVGHFAAQLTKWKGANVIAVASGSHEAFLRNLGADEFIDYTKGAPEDAAHDVDLVLDTIGGPVAGRLLKPLKQGGALFLVFPLGFSDAEKATSRGVAVSAAQVQSSGTQLTEIAHLMEDEAVRVAIDSTFRLAEAHKAHELATQGHIRGKIVLTVK
jgi:NADPH:quinone reductase and related Zn-dependent oxidoreductases